MPDIASTDVTYTNKSRGFVADARTRTSTTVAFGDGVLTYPAGGVPLLRGNLGAPTLVESFNIQDPASANGFVYKYDSINEKLRIYQGDNDNVADAALIELVGGVATPALATLVLEVLGY